MPWMRLAFEMQPDRRENELREAARIAGVRVRFDPVAKRGGHGAVILYDDRGSELAQFTDPSRALAWLKSGLGA